MANIMGFSHMADKYHVTYDNEKEDAFVIRGRSTGNIVRFARDGRLYTYEPSKNYLAAVAKSKGMSTNNDKDTGKEYFEAVMTKEGNRDGYMDKQYERA